MKRVILTVLILIGSIATADVFDKGRSSVGIVAGSSSAHGETYTILGVGVDYFVVNGLSVGIGYYGWFGDEDNINQLTLSSSYYLPLSQKLRPYVGGFIRESFVSSSEDYTSYGARGGLAITMSPNSYMSFGYTYEKYGNCSETIYRDCSSSYPELVFSLSF